MAFWPTLTELMSDSLIVTDMSKAALLVITRAALLELDELLAALLAAPVAAPLAALLELAEELELPTESPSWTFS
jgi:hypothetical protein